MKKITLAGAVIVCSIALCACGKNAKKLNNTGIEYYNAEQYDKAVKAFEEAVDKDKVMWSLEIMTRQRRLLWLHILMTSRQRRHSGE